MWVMVRSNTGHDTLGTGEKLAGKGPGLGALQIQGGFQNGIPCCKHFVEQKLPVPSPTKVSRYLRKMSLSD